MSKNWQTSYRVGWRRALLLVGFGGLAIIGLAIPRFRGSRSNPSATATRRQSDSQLDDSPAVADAGQSKTDPPNSDQGALPRPTRICTDLRVFDIQVGTGNQIEGAWLATAQSPSPVMVAVGQRFGSGNLKRALLSAERHFPEVWMDTDYGPCLAILSEQPTPPRSTAGAPSVTQAPTPARMTPQLAANRFEVVRNMAKQLSRQTIDSTQDAGPAVGR